MPTHSSRRHVSFRSRRRSSFINPDELVEVTPKAIRLRKRILDHNARKADEKRSGTGQFAG